MSKPFDYKEAAKKLRAFGLGGNYNLSRKLSPQQKGAITRKYEQFKTIVNYPEQYQILTVKNKTAKGVNIAVKKTKLKGGKSKLIVPVEKGQSVKVNRKGEIVLKQNGFESIIKSGSEDFFTEADKLFKKKLKRNQYIEVRIGSSAPFSMTFRDKTALLNYVSNFQPKDDPKEFLIGQMLLTTVTAPKNFKLGKKKQSTKPKRK